MRHPVEQPIGHPRLVALEEPMRHIKIFVDDHLGRRAIFHRQLGSSRPHQRAQHRVEAVDLPIGGQHLGDHAVELVLFTHGSAHDGREQPHIDIMHPAILEPLAALGGTEAEADKFVDHRLSTGRTLLGLEQRLHAVTPLAARTADLKVALMLTGTMQGYTWAIEGGEALKVKQGQRVEVSMHNMSMMTHPMHLHGHHFQVVGINGRPVAGALRDTVLIPPMAQVTVAFDADNPGRWPLHCHHLYHMATGMMSFVTYDTFG